MKWIYIFQLFDGSCKYYKTLLTIAPGYLFQIPSVPTVFDSSIIHGDTSISFFLLKFYLKQEGFKSPISVFHLSPFSGLFHSGKCIFLITSPLGHESWHRKGPQSTANWKLCLMFFHAFAGAVCCLVLQRLFCFCLTFFSSTFFSVPVNAFCRATIANRSIRDFWPIDDALIWNSGRPPDGPRLRDYRHRRRAESSHGKQ